jgi:hypothetical protein
MQPTQQRTEQASTDRAGEARKKAKPEEKAATQAQSQAPATPHTSDGFEKAKPSRIGDLAMGTRGPVTEQQPSEPTTRSSTSERPAEADPNRGEVTEQQPSEPPTPSSTSERPAEADPNRGEVTEQQPSEPRETQAQTAPGIEPATSHEKPEDLQRISREMQEMQDEMNRRLREDSD